MKKEYTKFTRQNVSATGEPVGELEENTMVSLIADAGKLIKQISTGITGTRVDIGTGDSESNYEEVDDPNWTKVTAEYRKQLASEVSEA